MQAVTNAPIKGALGLIGSGGITGKGGTTKRPRLRPTSGSLIARKRVLWGLWGLNARHAGLPLVKPLGSIPRAPFAGGIMR